MGSPDRTERTVSYTNRCLPQWGLVLTLGTHFQRVGLERVGYAVELCDGPALEGPALAVEALSHGLGDEHLVGTRRLAQARGDVHVDADVVAADRPRAAEVETRAKLRVVAVGADLGAGDERGARGLHGLGGIGEDRHRAVAEPLDHLPAALLDRGAPGGVDAAKEVERALVPCGERPGGEPDQVGEEDRHLVLAA